MANYLKRGKDAAIRAAEDAKVRDIVEATLADIDKRGDAAVRDLSNKFDSFDRDDYRLSDAEIQECLATVPDRDLDDPVRLSPHRLSQEPHDDRKQDAG